jgi:hypothetical protein
MKELIQKLETAVLRRNPLLAGNLLPGLPVEKIKKELKKAGIEGAVDPIVTLYSWKNGSDLQKNPEALNAGFTPPLVYELSAEEKEMFLNMTGVKRETASKTFHFVRLKMAILNAKSYKEYAKYDSRLSVLVGRYFPILWDGSNDQIALDLESSNHGRIVLIQQKGNQLLTEAYDSFENFLKDLVEANENNRPLACTKKSQFLI